MKKSLLNLLYLLPALICFNGFAQTTYNTPERIYYKFNTVGTTVTNDASAPVGTNPAPITGGLTVGAGGFSASNGLIGTGQTSTGNTVNTGWNTDMTGDFTIAFWTSAVPSSTTLFYIFGDNGASGFRCFTNGAAGAGNWLIRIPNGGDVTFTGGATSAPKMMHVVYDASALSVTAYVDGVQVDQSIVTAALNETGTGLTVGGYSSSTGLNGVLDEFRWYDRALDANEIGLTYNQELPFTVVCGVPQNFAETNLTSTSVDITWDHGFGNDNYQLEYGPTGFVPGTGTLISGAITGVSNVENITGLLPNTTYDYYITEDCNGGADELTFGSYTFTTSCGVTTAPYIENFDGASWDAGSGNIDPCWTRNPATGFAFEANSGGTPSGATGPSDDFTGGGNYVYTEGSSGSMGDVAELVSTPIDLSALTSPYMTFYYHMYGADITSLIVEISNDGGTTWTTESTIVGQQQTTNGDAWLQQPINLSGYVNDVIQVRFSTAKGASLNNDVAIDELEIAEAPSCPRPYDLTVSNITATDADASWTQGYLETQWIVEYDTAGFVQGTGMTIVTSNLTETLTGLSAVTDYDVYVRGICGPSDTSDWTGPVTFTTPCATYLAPFYESFDNGVQPDCWENLATGTSSTDFWKFSGTPGYAAANNGRPDDTYAWSDGSGNEPEGTLITPFIDLTTINDPYLTFDWFSNNENTPGDNVPLYVEINGGTVWTALDTLSGDSTDWMGASYDLNAYGDSIVRIRFITDHTMTSGSAFYNDILLDEVRVWNCINEAGTDNAADACRIGGDVDLNSLITIVSEGGRWDFPINQSFVVDDTLLNVEFLPSGTYEAYYITGGACQEDTAVATITVYPPSSAGVNGSLNVCLNQPIDLFSGLSGNVDLGGTWYDPSNSPISGSLPAASNIPGNYNYDYIVSNGVCPADTSLLVVTVDGSCDYLSIGEEQLSEITVYPNPATDVVTISNSSNSEALSVQMFDVNGRVVLSDANAFVNVSEASIDIRHLQKGIYTLRIYNEKSQRTFRIVKQ